QNDYDLIHTHTVRASLIGSIVSVITKLPMVHHVHSPSTRDTESPLRNFRNSLTEDMCIRRAARLIAVSASLEKYLIEKGKRADRIRVVPNGVPIEPDFETPGFDGGKLILGTVALFRPRKGIEILLEAISRLRSIGLDVVLHAVGPFETEEYKNSIDRLVTELRLEDAITWTGFTKDVISEFSNMHVFVLPSLYGEGMPMVVLEAMSMGLPVISTTVEGIPEVVRDGIEGLLIKPDDTEAMVSTIGNIIQGKIDLAAMGQASKRRQRNQFSDQSMAEGVAAVYRELLS
ncbi:MAG: glycosyltransferase, partial [candidate division Zixibacteria bacterium]